MSHPLIPSKKGMWIGWLLGVAPPVAMFTRLFIGETLLQPLIIGLAAAINVVYWLRILVNWHGVADQYLDYEQRWAREEARIRFEPVEQRQEVLRRHSIFMGIFSSIMLLISIVWIVLDLFGYENLA